MNFLTTEKEIVQWLTEHKVTKYGLTPDPKYGFIVDVGKSVDLSQHGLDFIPVKFGHIKSSFNCTGNKLTSLEGCPHTVGKDFKCADNQLSSLKHCPQKIGGDFLCYGNQLTSLEFSPSYIPGRFICRHNLLTSLEHCPVYVGDHFNCRANKLENLDFLPEYVGSYFTYIENKSLKLLPRQDFTELLRLKKIKDLANKLDEDLSNKKLVKTHKI